MKLNRLQRIGIVISILWAVGAAYHERSSEMETGQHFLDLSYQICIESKKSTLDGCLVEMNKSFDIWMKPNWGNIGFIALAPIPLGWLLVFITIRVYRWVKAGPI
ncbi:MAG: hypothetical protein Q8K62_02475 [Thiobacillus sp.]|nr:hypothetical protein [Thiobacillus sp.]